MKVVYILPSTGLYGDNKALLNIMPKLVELGIEPFFVITAEKRPPVADELEKLGYRYLYIGANYYNARTPSKKSIRTVLGRWRRNLYSRARNYKKLKSVVAEFSPYIIHTNCTFTRLGYKLAHDLRVPHLWHVREYGKLDHEWEYIPSKEGFEHKLNAPLNYSVYITEDILNYFNKPARSSVLYDGVFDSTQRPEIKKSDKGYFLYVGRLVPTKGIEDLIRAYLEVASHANCPLKIAGTGDANYTEYLKSICRESANGNKVEFLGFQKDIPTLMSEARALIVPSRFEAFGFITAEAMFYGCPVICHNTGGCKLQLDNGLKLYSEEIGFRYESREELSSNLLKLANSSRSDLIELLVKAQNTAIEFYSIQQSAKYLFDKYKHILAETH